MIFVSSGDDGGGMVPILGWGGSCHWFAIRHRYLILLHVWDEISVLFTVVIDHWEIQIRGARLPCNSRTLCEGKHHSNGQQGATCIVQFKEYYVHQNSKQYQILVLLRSHDLGENYVSVGTLAIYVIILCFMPPVHSKLRKTVSAYNRLSSSSCYFHTDFRRPDNLI